jgi:hypothetical protein
MLSASVPKTAVNKYNEVLLLENYVGLSQELAPSPKAKS